MFPGLISQWITPLLCTRDNMSICGTDEGAILEDRPHKGMTHDCNRDFRRLLETQTTTIVDMSHKILSAPRHTNETKIRLSRPFAPVVYLGHTLDVFEVVVDSKLGLDFGLILYFHDHRPVALHVVCVENDFGGSERSARAVRNECGTYGEARESRCSNRSQISARCNNTCSPSRYAFQGGEASVCGIWWETKERRGYCIEAGRLEARNQTVGPKWRGKFKVSRCSILVQLRRVETGTNPATAPMMLDCAGRAN